MSSRTGALSLRLSSEEREAFEAGAAASERTLSEFVRLVVLSAVSGTNRLAPDAAIEAGIRAKIAGEHELASAS